MAVKNNMDQKRLLELAGVQLNEVSDWDGKELNDLIANFKKAIKAFGIENDEVKKKELTQVLLSRVGSKRK